MSTKSTLYLSNPDGSHKLQIHIFKDLHEANEKMVVEFECSTCYCSYKFLMDDHLGEQLANMLKRSEKNWRAERAKRKKQTRNALKLLMKEKK